MTTPTQRAPINGYEGDTPDDLNQLLGSPSTTVVMDSNTAILSPASVQLASVQPLDVDGVVFAYDQPVTLSGEIDSVSIPVSIASGSGANLMVGLYADSVGIPAGAAIAQTYVPREMLVTTAISGQTAAFTSASMGAWSALNNQMPVPNTYGGQGTVQSPTNVLIFGGTVFSAGTFYTQVWISNFNNGTLGPWIQSPNQYPVSLYNMGACYCNGYAIGVGGNPGSSHAYIVDTFVSSLGPSGSSAWSQQANLPIGLELCATASDGVSNVYVCGGLSGIDGASTTRQTIYQATISPYGAITAWNAITSLPAARSSMAAVCLNGWLVMIGGCDNSNDPHGTGTPKLTVWGARILPSGSLGGIVTFPSYPGIGGFGFQSPQATVVGDAIIVTGQVDGEGAGDYAVTLDVTADGPAPQWVLQPNMGFNNTTSGFIAISTGDTTFNAVAITGDFPATPVSYQSSGVITSFVSVPLRATGLASATYHVVVSIVGGGDPNNTSQVVLSSVAPSGSYAATNVKANAGVWQANLLNILPADSGPGVGNNWIFQGLPSQGSIVVNNGVGLLTTLQNGQLVASLGVLEGGSLNTETAVSIAPSTSYTMSILSQAITGAGVNCIIAFNWWDIDGNYLGQNSGAGAADASILTSVSYTASSPSTAAFLSVDIIYSTTTAGQQHAFTNVIFAPTSALTYIPLSVYGNGATLRPIHVINDMANGQPNEYSWIVYDYWGKPIQYFESTLPLANLLSPNASSFGGAVQGTTAAWTPSNATLSVVTAVTPAIGQGATKNSSALYPPLNVQQTQYAMQMSASSAATMSAESPTGTSGFPVTPSVSYSLSAYFQAVSTGRNVNVEIQWYTAAGASISTSTGSNVADVSTTYVQATVTATAPATAAFAAWILKVISPANTENHLVAFVDFGITSELNNEYFAPGCGPGGVQSMRTLSYNANGTLAAVS